MSDARKAAVDAALKRMEDALEASENPQEGADTDALVRKFDEAKNEYDVALAAHQRAQLVEEARKNAPVQVVEETPEAEERTETEATAEVRVRSEGEGELIYRQGGETSIFRDLANVKVKADPKAAERLQSHVEQMERAHPNQTAGEGGEFIPPLWLQDRWIKLPRAGRAAADTLTGMPLPAGTNQINLPKVSAGATVEVQSDGGSVSSTDITTTSVTAQVQTIAGQQDISIQLLDMSNPGFDQVVFDDLTRAYDVKLDTKVLSGTVTNAKGLLELSGTETITYTQATPTVPLLYPKVANGIQKIQTQIYDSPSVIVMHPRRWASILASLDSQNRPLVVPGDVGQAFNQIASVSDVAAQARVGYLQGLPVVIDPNLPTNEGASTNQDAVLIYRAENLFLWESAPKLRTFGEVLSNTLQVRFQVYGYYAIMAGRLPKSISKITGTGLVEPSF